MEDWYESKVGGIGRRKKGIPPPIPPPRIPTPRPKDPTKELKTNGSHILSCRKIHNSASIYSPQSEWGKDSRAPWINPRLLSKVEERGSESQAWVYLKSSRVSISTSPQSAAAAAFFARASQKLNMSSGGIGASPVRRRRGGSSSHNQQEEASGFALALVKNPPQLPPPLLRKLGTKEISGLGKVRVMLRVCEGLSGTGSEDQGKCAVVDSRRRQVTLFDPSVPHGGASTSGLITQGAGSASSPVPPASPTNATPDDRRLGIAAPKMFAFDAVFTDQEPQSEICSSALSDLIHAVINGSDASLFCLGHPKIGRSMTMFGNTDSGGVLGVIPSAISWLFRCIAEQKQKSGTRFSVRVSATEVASQSLRDLLAQHATENDQSPGIYLCEGGLQSFCELRAPSPEKAAYYLDSALASRSPDQSHLFYTLHIYQYSVAGKGGVAGGRSRLHLIDLGNCEKSKIPGGLPLSAIGNVLLAIFNGQKHFPHKDHKLTQQLKECLGSLTCHAAMIAHISPYSANYTDTLTTVQIASRIHRMRRRKFKFMGNSGGLAGEDMSRLTGSSDVDPSSSEQSADTVIYVGPAEETDGEHPPVYIPSLNSGDNRCAMGKALRGSLVDHKTKTISKSVPASPQKCQIDERSHKKQQKSSSTKSSPARSIVKPTSREEQWVDGPRIPKSRVTEGRNIHMSKDKKETWVDGPRISNGHTSYGFMDYHKKSMIRKWVENQSIHNIKSKHQFKEMTVFKTCEEARGRASGQEDEGLPSSSSQTTCINSQPIARVLPQERLPCSGVETRDGDEQEDMEIEIIEIEEPSEPVPMQDSCLQVTEEDIALCMGELENPLPEVDQEEHPLRILSQENLTVVSTFTDSLSIANDLERLFPRNQSVFNQRNGWPNYHNQTKEIITNKISHYEQLSQLHELYSTKTDENEMRPVSRCQSLMFSELIAELPNDFDTNSIASEPAYISGERNKLCDNCKVTLENKYDITSLWYKQETPKFQSYQQLTRSISSLRHPDGASNPNLGEACRREPGNGAEKDKDSQPKLDDEEEISLPPPLHSNLLTLNREGFESLKNKYMNTIDIKNGLVHDPGGKGNGKINSELKKNWSEPNRIQKAKETRKDENIKGETGPVKHRFFPFGHGGLLGRRSHFGTNSRSTNPPQAS